MTKTFKHLLLSTTTVAMISASALAADLPSRTAPPALKPVPAFSWTGFYVGGTIGALSLRTRTLGPDYGALDYYLGRLQERSNGAGVVIGGTLGFNYQLAPNFVVGLEADLSYSTAQNSFSKSGVGEYVSGSVLINADGKSQITSFGTVRARMGYAADRTLFFVTGGVAYGNVKGNFSTTTRFTGLSSSEWDCNYSFKKTRLGWTAGAGVEHALTNNLTLKLEALYFDLGTVSAKAPGTTNPSCAASFKNDGGLVRAGINYKF